ncbi:MAG: PIN domain-containing protein [Chloroflexi bacterium]|nr:MAG: PIN domain-containing protein [Chloroflexota bacterium]
MTIITDSSFIYALYNTKDSYHRQAMEFSEQYTGRVIIPDVILPEVSYLLVRDLGYHGVQEFLGKFKEVGHSLEPLANSDLIRVHEISVEYSSAEFDIVDCCIMALAERLYITKIATFDRRDFSIFRPHHCDYLELLP